MPAITILCPILADICQRECSLAFDKVMESSLFRDPNQQWWRWRDSYFSFGPFLPWCIAHLLNFYLPCLILRGCTVGLGREVLMTRVGKQILIQTMKDFRVKSQGPLWDISIPMGQEAKLLFCGSNLGLFGFPHILTYEMEHFSVWLCHHSDLQSLVLRCKA